MSGESEWGPLSAGTVRTLTDKLYEKRKAAALEIEKQVRDLAAKEDWTALRSLLEVLGRLARSQNPHNRKGGLIGLAAAGIGLGKSGENFVDSLVLPVLEAFTDPDSRVRYFACESLYNICKVARNAVISKGHFPILFDTLCRLAADPDQNVRNGGDVLDKLMKDIVSSETNLDLGSVVHLIRERIHSKESRVRRFLIAWLQTLHSLPSSTLIDFLPEILDGLFTILSDKDEKLQEMTSGVLSHFLASLKNQPSDFPIQDQLNVLVVHAQSSEPLVQEMGLSWLRSLVELKGAGVLPQASGILTALLPCLALAESRAKAHDLAKALNALLLRLLAATKPESLHLESLIAVLSSHLAHSAVQTRVAVLKWIHHLHRNFPAEVLPLLEELFPRLLRMLSDSSDEVVLLDLEVMSAMCKSSADEGGEGDGTGSSENPYLVKFARALLGEFRSDTGLLAERGSFIIRQLSLLLEPWTILCTLASLLKEEEELEFAGAMVKALSSILLTATEFHALRNALRTPAASPASTRHFRLMYQAWAHQPVALLSLCLLARRYAHAAALVQTFPSLEVTTDLLLEVDKLIQLLESPIFAYLRLELLEPDSQAPLARVLYGLLMLLPQTEAFLSLQRRLQSLPLPPPAPKLSLKEEEDPATKGLLSHFQELQAKHLQYRRSRHRLLLNPPPTL